MKKSFITLIISAFAVMIIGIILCVIAKNQAAAAGVDLSGIGDDSVRIEIDPQTVTKINLILPEAALEVRGGAESSYVELVNFHTKTYSMSNKNGTLEINDEFNISSLLNMTKNQFNFQGIRSILSMGKMFTDKKIVRVYLSDNDKFALSAEIKKGSAGFEDTAELGDIYVSVNSGKINLSDTKAASATVSTDNGEIYVTGCEINKATFKLHSGKINYNTNSFFFHNINIENEKGKTSVLGEYVKSPYEKTDELAYLNVSIFALDAYIEISGK